TPVALLGLLLVLVGVGMTALEIVEPDEALVPLARGAVSPHPRRLAAVPRPSLAVGLAGLAAAPRRVGLRAPRAGAPGCRGGGWGVVGDVRGAARSAVRGAGGRRLDAGAPRPAPGGARVAPADRVAHRPDAGRRRVPQLCAGAWGAEHRQCPVVPRAGRHHSAGPGGNGGAVVRPPTGRRWPGDPGHPCRLLRALTAAT